jgi:hypothetical protein
MKSRTFIAGALLAAMVGSFTFRGQAAEKTSARTPAVEEIPQEARDFLAELVDGFLDATLSDPQLAGTFMQLIKELATQEILGEEGAPKDPKEAASVGKFIGEFMDEILADPKIHALLMKELRERLRGDILREAFRDPEVKKLLREGAP